MAQVNDKTPVSLPNASSRLESGRTIGKAEATTGLCLNCVHATECSYRANDRAVVHTCGDHAVAADLCVDDASTNRADAPPAAQESPAQGRGLCVNCEQRDGCMHADLEIGIWHCEEYS